MLSRLPWTPVPETKRPSYRLPAARRAHLVDVAANILRQGEPTKFAFSATIRHSIRRGLCLQGWGWALADGVADEIVTAALNRIGAQRPTWRQGQPEYTQEGHSPIERTRCIRCARPVPDEHAKWCSRRCWTLADREREAADWWAYQQAARSYDAVG